MRKCIFSFFCVLALAACSPKTFSGVQEARASAHAQLYDSAAVSRWVNASLQEYIDKHFERVETLRTETVREVLSAPDSAGVQHVVERSTTHTVSGARTQAGASLQKTQQLEERRDSVAVADSVRTEKAEIYEEIKEAPAKRAPWLPWYVYVGGLVAALLCGVYLGWKHRRTAI